MAIYVNGKMVASFGGRQGPRGKPGDTPYIGENGNWWIGDTDTGVVASAATYRFKGSVSNAESLPISENEIGDMWNAESTGINYAWNGEKWDVLGVAFEIQSITDAEIDAIMSEI